MAARLKGSEDLFKAGGRGPIASINFVTAHDGFTLHDLVSYSTKHNAANREDNRDGADNNRSSNFGVEGPTDDPAIVKSRDQQKRNLLATLLFSRGVPMLLAGDELGRTQEGNNNAYCHDSELSWVEWGLDAGGRELLEFTARSIALRKKYPGFRKRNFSRDITWLAPHGGEMTEADWKLPFARCLGALFDKDLLLLLNAHDGEILFRLPDGPWNLQMDTAGKRNDAEIEKAYPLQPRSLALLVKPRSSGPARTDG
jgi:glycogen operon protein